MFVFRQPFPEKGREAGKLEIPPVKDAKIVIN
jgi:hypothetical protein